jgi:hypothetical protein
MAVRKKMSMTRAFLVPLVVAAALGATAAGASSASASTTWTDLPLDFGGSSSRLSSLESGAPLDRRAGET